ncbi:MAG: sugar transferase [Coriobacteriia bacterium]|nr:sugar transferase [Coriobacteriia bacterium]
MTAARRPYDALKRILDVVFSALLLVLLAPLLGLIALGVSVAMGPPVLFTQQRPGRDGRIFTLLKFRTMDTAPNAPSAISAVSSDAERLTAFGRFLRSTSLDELPQLMNTLKGDMSFVGPRPWLPEYLPHYTAEQTRRHDVRPGITGWAQVNGRNTASWEDRLAMDVWYVDHRSLALDLRILARTVGATLTGRGVSTEGEATTRPFVELPTPEADNQPEPDCERTDP